MKNIALGIAIGVIGLVIIIWNRGSLGPNTIDTYEISKLKTMLFCQQDKCAEISPIHYPKMLDHITNLEPTSGIGLKGEKSIEYGYLMLEWDGHERIYIRFWSRQSIKDSIIAQFQHRGDSSTSFYGNYLGNDLFKFLDSHIVPALETK